MMAIVLESPAIALLLEMATASICDYMFSHMVQVWWKSEPDFMHSTLSTNNFVLFHCMCQSDIFCVQLAKDISEKH